MKNLLQQLSEQAVQFEVHHFTDEEVKAQYIGRPPASEEAIADAEKRLGVALPQDVKDFYKVSNGTSIILNQCFGAFVPVEKIGWLKDVDNGLIEVYTGITEELTNNLNNSIIIAGVNYCHSILIIQPYGENKEWRYWEFASYIPGETPFTGIEKYLERLIDFMTEQNKNKNETLNK